MSRRRGAKEEDDEVPVRTDVPGVVDAAEVSAAIYTDPNLDHPAAGLVPPVASSSNNTVVEKLFEENFDHMTLDKLYKLLEQCTKSQVDEIMSQREQEMQNKIHEEKASRKEAFPDSEDGYFYTAMLANIYEILHERVVGTTRQRNKIIAPITEKVGKKKTIITNFAKICESFNRAVEDVKAFIETEISCTSNLTGDNALILRFEARKATQFDQVIVKYLDKWVKCNACKSTDTILRREERHYELFCNNCHASRTITKEDKGTAANTEKRSKRNPTTL